MEKSLGPDAVNDLLEAQGSFAGSAFARCISSTGSAPTDFTVVVELGSDGRVKNSWLRGESAFAKCVRDSMVETFSFHSSASVFFTSFEYTNAP